ncbi:transporter substrate-binding domain-containing protein [Colwellia sp. MEBiC06753]
MKIVGLKLFIISLIFFQAFCLAKVVNSPLHSNSTKLEVCSLTLAPQTMLNEHGKPDGFAVKILQAIAPTLGWRLNVTYFPWSRVVHKSKLGECDIVLTVLMRSDYASYMVFPQEPILLQKNVVVVRSDSDITFDGNIVDFVKLHPIAMYRDKAIDDNF